jgi:speckle-type POZ protein
VSNPRRLYSAAEIIVSKEKPSWRLELPSTGYIRNDRMIIQCDLTVVRDPELCKTKGGFEIQVPPSDLAEQFGKLLLEEEETDVVFSVGGETFPAHKVVLAARSPVFKAQLYGNMKEAKARRVAVEDMQPGVFRALLKFIYIYTDALPVIGDDNICDDDYDEIIRHLLVAADRYAMDRLKLLCASVLVERLRVETGSYTDLSRPAKLRGDY